MLVWGDKSEASPWEIVCMEDLYYRRRQYPGGQEVSLCVEFVTVAGERVEPSSRPETTYHAFILLAAMFKCEVALCFEDGRLISHNDALKGIVTVVLLQPRSAEDAGLGSASLS